MPENYDKLALAVATIRRLAEAMEKGDPRKPTTWRVDLTPAEREAIAPFDSAVIFKGPSAKPNARWRDRYAAARHKIATAFRVENGTVRTVEIPESFVGSGEWYTWRRYGLIRDEWYAGSPEMFLDAARETIKRLDEDIAYRRSEIEKIEERKARKLADAELVAAHFNVGKDGAGR